MIRVDNLTWFSSFTTQRPMLKLPIGARRNSNLCKEIPDCFPLERFKILVCVWMKLHEVKGRDVKSKQIHDVRLVEQSLWINLNIVVIWFLQINSFFSKKQTSSPLILGKSYTKYNDKYTHNFLKSNTCISIQMEVLYLKFVAWKRTPHDLLVYDDWTAGYCFRLRRSMYGVLTEPQYKWSPIFMPLDTIVKSPS